MKLVLILILVIQISLIKPNTAQNETSSDSKVATSFKSDKTMTQTERHIPETSISRRTKFVVTRRPPIHVRHNKIRRVKKIPLKMKIHNRYKTIVYINPKNFSVISHVGKPILNHKKHIATKPNKYVNNSIINKINTTDNLNEYKNEPTKKQIQTEFVCNGPEMNIVSHVKVVGGKEKLILNSSKLKDLRKLHKCLLRLKGLENAFSNNKRKQKHKNGNFKSNDKDAVVNIGSSEYKLNENNLQFVNNLRNDPIAKSVNEGQATENIDHSLSKRQINIIEEESVGTTSSGFKFTDRDLLHSQLLYRNIQKCLEFLM